MKTVSEEQIKDGQAVYTPLILLVYDLWVVRFSNHWMWRCPKTKQLQQFQQYVTNNHLDIGVGTGYYLQQCTWPENTKLSLMDLNPNCLETAKKAVAQLNPELHQADIFKPQVALANRFKSISMNFLLHCLPGDMENKSTAIGNAAAMLQENGVLFGATILGDRALHTLPSAMLAAFYNHKGIFSNHNDTLESLERALAAHLKDVSIEVIGAVALFHGIRK